LWVVVVCGVPYVIYGLLEGFPDTFRSGGASLFVCIAIAAALGESLVGLAMKAFTRRPVGHIDREEVVGLYVLSIGFFAWNMYFAVADKTVRIQTVDWVQILIFALGLFFGGLARWSTETGALEPLVVAGEGLSKA